MYTCIYLCVYLCVCVSCTGTRVLCVSTDDGGTQQQSYTFLLLLYHIIWFIISTRLFLVFNLFRISIHELQSFLINIQLRKNHNYSAPKGMFRMRIDINLISEILIKLRWINYTCNFNRSVIDYILCLEKIN